MGMIAAWTLGCWNDDCHLVFIFGDANGETFNYLLGNSSNSFPASFQPIGKFPVPAADLIVCAFVSIVDV
ncbi:MAG: hypothetical protein ACI84C_001054 [Flavobacteriales bacterium]|jgi:hypothetical protein